MQPTQLLILQITAHILSDFLLQSQQWSNGKETHGFRSKHLYYHMAITFLCSWILSFRIQFIWFAFLITIIHFIEDGIKIKLERWFKQATFFVDQGIHLLTIVLITLWYEKHWNHPPLVELPFSLYHLSIMLGVILCLKPANIAIQAFFRLYRIKLLEATKTSVLNSGKLIGNVERILILTLILSGQFQAVGFVIAAKSILRYKEADFEKSEYVLVGTLLSFTLAIFTGLAIVYMKK